MSGQKRMQTSIQAGGRIELAVSDWPVGQVVEVTIRPMAAAPPRQSAIDILREAPGGLLFKTAEQVDSYIRGERESWEN